MDGAKAEVLLALLAVLILPATGFSFRVQVSPDAGVTTTLFSYSNSTERVQNFSANVYNSGSIGCKYRLKAVYNSSNSSKVFYSNPVALFPGAEKEIVLETVPGEENRTRKGEVFVEFCGNEKKVGNFSYIQEKKVRESREEVGVKVEDVNSSGVIVKTEVKDGVLLPSKVPPHWKVSTSRIVNGSSKIFYEPYMFNRNRELEFIVYNRSSGAMEGRFDISLDRKKPFFRRFTQKNLLLGVTAISLVTNIFLFIRAINSKD